MIRKRSWKGRSSGGSAGEQQAGKGMRGIEKRYRTGNLTRRAGYG